MMQTYYNSNIEIAKIRFQSICIELTMNHLNQVGIRYTLHYFPYKELIDQQDNHSMDTRLPEVLTNPLRFWDMLADEE